MENDSDISLANRESLQKLFDPFFRSDSRNGNGAGLGLYVVKLLAEKMGMQVSADILEKEEFVFRIMLSGKII